MTTLDPRLAVRGYAPRHSRPDSEESPAGEISQRLSRLPAGWHVVNAIPDVDRAIDHLVIGPAGVFAVSVKHHLTAKVWTCSDTFQVDGRNQPYVLDARTQAARAAALLSAAALFDVEVHGVIAVVGAHRGFTVKEQPRDVTVVTRKTITGYLHSLPVVLGTPSTERIYKVARRRTTWRVSA